MFNFIFDGNIGKILAPVVPSNQFHLAIQHHKNVEVTDLMVNNTYQVNTAIEGGYSAIHVACRYNNQYALELLLKKGLYLFQKIIFYTSFKLLE